MKKITLLFTLTFSILLGFGQYGGGSPETIELWKNKTLIVMQYPGYEIYNTAVKTVVNERWYNNKIEFLDYTSNRNYKVLKKRKDAIILCVDDLFDVGAPVICFAQPTHSFFYNKTGWAYVNIQSDHEIEYKKWKSDLKKNNPNSIPSTDAYGLEILNRSTLERTILLIELLFNTTDQFKSGEFRYKSAKKDNGFYNTSGNINKIKNKTLLIERKSISRKNDNKKLLQITHLQSIYKGEIKIVTEKELQETIIIRDKNLLYLQVEEVAHLPTYAIVDIAERKVVYCNQQSPPTITNNIKRFERMLENLSNSIF